jgi:hypothetical protein
VEEESEGGNNALLLPQMNMEMEIQPLLLMARDAHQTKWHAVQHCKKRHLRSVPFLKQFRLFTENLGKELNVKESSLKRSEEVFP